MHSYPEVGRSHPERREVARLPVQGKPVDQQGGEQDHPSDTTLAQHRPSSRGYRQQYQRGLGGDSIVVVPVSH